MGLFQTCKTDKVMGDARREERQHCFQTSVWAQRGCRLSGLCAHRKQSTVGVFHPSIGVFPSGSLGFEPATLGALAALPLEAYKMPSDTHADTYTRICTYIYICSHTFTNTTACAQIHSASSLSSLASPVSTVTLMIYNTRVIKKMKGTGLG